MRFKCILIFGFALIFGSSLFAIQIAGLNVEGECEEYEGYLKKIIRNFSEDIHDEFNLLCISDGGSMHEKIKEVTLQLVAYKKTTIEKARKLEVILTERLREKINKEEKLRPYLVEYPFSS